MQPTNMQVRQTGVLGCCSLAALNRAATWALAWLRCNSRFITPKVKQTNKQTKRTGSHTPGTKYVKPNKWCVKLASATKGRAAFIERKRETCR